MYCPKCGTENPDDAQLCRFCSWVLTSISTIAPSPDAKTSGLAITSLVLGILSIFTLFLTALPAIILGIISIFKIEKSAGQLKGKGLAIAGITVPSATSYGTSNNDRNSDACTFQSQNDSPETGLCYEYGFSR